MDAVEAWLGKVQPDILLIQETKLSDTGEPGPLFRTGPSPKFVTTGPSMGCRDAIATPFQRPSPWWSNS